MNNPEKRVGIENTDFSYSDSQNSVLDDLAQRVANMRSSGELKGDALARIRKFFRIKNIYHSNAIEGNTLNIGETRVVVERGLTITGKPLKDQAEAKNLSQALDFLEEVVKKRESPILESNVREIHRLVLKDVDNENAGAYRSVNVEISGSAFTPPGPESLVADMQSFGDWLKAVTSDESRISGKNAVIAAAVAHTWFVIIHPFIDGNGRVARLLLNLILMRAGFPPAIITRDDRQRYYDSLEEARRSNLAPFIALLTDSIKESLEEYEAASQKLEYEDVVEAIDSAAAQLSQYGKRSAPNDFDVWSNAIELLKSYFNLVVETVHSKAGSATVKFKNFDLPEYQKYVSFLSGHGAKKTWFFRIDFVSSESTARYLFFFGSASRGMEQCSVTLHIAKEEPPNSWHYEKLSDISASNVPDIHELGYDPQTEKFMARRKGADPQQYKMEELVDKFFKEVVDKHFSG